MGATKLKARREMLVGAKLLSYSKSVSDDLRLREVECTMIDTPVVLSLRPISPM